MGNQLLIYSGGSYREYRDPVQHKAARDRGRLEVTLLIIL
jgi:hypothetical protein